MRHCCSLLCLMILVTPARSLGQESPAIPDDLQKTYGAFAAAMVQGDAERAVGFYAEDAVLLVDHEHVYQGLPAVREGFLADSVLTIESSVPTPSHSAGGFSCTQVLGFSQSMQWYAGRSFADHVDENSRPDLSALAPDAFLPGWQGRFFLGAAVERWTDPEFPGWSGTHRLAHETPVNCGRDEVDRLVFNVSGAARPANAWAAAVDSVADVIRVKFPAVRRVVMQPVVGAPEGECRDVRAARNHPVIAEGIRRAAHQDGITAGPSPKVASCDQFTDVLGHLTVEGAEHVRRTLREHYRPSTTGSGRDRRAAVQGSAPELLRRPYTSAETGREREYFVYLPRGYRDAPREDWPVIFYLHGSGERGDGGEDLDWVLGYGPLYEAWIQKRDLPFIIVSPQLPVFGRTGQVDEGRSAGGEPPRRLEDGTPPRYEICPLDGEGDCLVVPHRRAFDRARGGARPIVRTGADDFERVRPFGMDFDYPPEEWPPDGWFRVEEDLVTILDDVLGEFRADPDRVYLTGVSYGGFGAFDLAASHPDRWAALAPVVGTGDLDDAPVLAEAGLPIWMFAGGTDPLVKPHWLYDMARALEEAGHPDVRLTVHEDMTHDAWWRVYEGRDLYDWFLSQRRSQQP